MEFKGTGSALVKDIDGKSGTVVAYWSAFNNKDDGADIMMPGAWSRSIAERGPQSKQPRVKFLYQHDDKMLVAAPSALVEDDFGLLATYTIPQTTLGKDVLLLYDAGVISEHSVGFTLNLSTWDRAQQARLLQECVLWEGSAVTWGMNSQTPVVAVKALAQPGYLARLAEQAKALDKLLHSGNLRDEKLCANLERELKALQTALAPAHKADSAPYTIKGVLDAMTQLQTRAKISSSTTKIEDEPATPVVDETKDDSGAIMTDDDGEELAPDFATMYATERDAWTLMSEMQGMLGALRNSVVGMLCAGDLSGLGASVSQFSGALEATGRMARRARMLERSRSRCAVIRRRAVGLLERAAQSRREAAASERSAESRARCASARESRARDQRHESRHAHESRRRHRRRARDDEGASQRHRRSAGAHNAEDRRQHRRREDRRRRESPAPGRC
jgi:HK97 family phage prohead protease